MGKLLLAAAAMLVVAWVGGGGGAAGGGLGILVAAQGSAPLVFGDDLPGAMPIVSKAPPSCVARSSLGGDVCEEDPEYDETIKRYALNLISRDNEMNALLRNPSLRTLLTDPLKEASRDADVSTRFGTQQETPVCSAQETIIYPKRAKTSREDWVFVLNQEGVQQALRVEKCISNGSSCNIGPVLPGEATATCRQKYVYRRMLVLGTNKIEPEEVLMPSCCVCYTTFENLLPRSGNASGAGNQTPAETASEPAASASPPVPTPGRPMALIFDNSRNGRTRFVSPPDRG